VRIRKKKNKRKRRGVRSIINKIRKRKIKGKGKKKRTTFHSFDQTGETV
jgi:hypothetical protein